MTSTAQSTRPRTMSPALFQKTPAASRAPVIGQRMPDGSVYAGISPDTGRAMYTTPKDTRLCADWYKAQECAAKFDTGHKDWRLPTKAELHQLFLNRAAIGKFDETGHMDRKWYWSSDEDSKTGAWAQRIGDDGFQHHGSKHNAASLRLVRG